MLGVTPSDYSQWRNRGKSNREKENDFLLAKIKDTYAENKGVYGSPRITQALHRQSISCSQPRVARLMRTNGIVAKTQRKFITTTDSNYTLTVAEDIVGQAFAVEGPDRLWVGDITYINTDEGWLYLAKVMDAHNREIIGWSVDRRMTKSLVIKAMERAIRKRRATGSPIFHSDRGSQYANYAFRKLHANNLIR
jgi:putative transposase|tara:strand:+ start:818 stop:1399 length:582 start_codon:yes stop_codon:yes gene_type:complete